jgi:hypothetical protein
MGRPLRRSENLTMDTQTDERWYVQFDSKEVKLMTLEELDAAFESGAIHENTFLIQVGQTEWQTLKDVAGLSDDAGEEEEENTGPTTAIGAPPVQAAPAPVVAAHVAQAAPQPVRSVNPPAGAVQGGWPPVTTSSPPPSLSSGHFASSLPSTIPVVSDLDSGDLDVSAQSFKSGKKKLAVFGLAAAVALGGIGYAVKQLDAPPAHAAVAVPAAPATGKLTPWVPPAPTTAPAAAPEAAAAPAPAATTEASGSNKLSDDMKKALLAQDDDRSAKKGAKASKKKGATARASGAVAKSGSKKTGGAFRAGGNDNDPLNGKL